PVCSMPFRSHPRTTPFPYPTLFRSGKGGRAVFALCRPPGHHAAADYYGGYCFLNNAAIAAQAWRDKGAAKLAVLDVDYHHGNGTDRKSTRLNSSHVKISYAVFCLKR